MNNLYILKSIHLKIECLYFQICKKFHVRIAIRFKSDKFVDNLKNKHIGTTSVDIFHNSHNESQT